MEVRAGISERELNGNVLWRAPSKYIPDAAYRLPNRNTVFPYQYSLLEITPEGKEANIPLKGPLHDGQMFVANWRWLPNDHFLGSTNPSLSMEALGEFDPSTGRLIRKINLQDRMEQGRIKPLPNGHYLISGSRSGRVIEASLDENYQKIKAAAFDWSSA
jgi:hypothetical protein